MAPVKRYRQFCALARTLDVVGDRWTLLLIRELMIAPGGYASLLARLPGIATNLLAERLARLQRDGLVVKRADHSYELTPRGLQLRPALHELIKWGGPYMVQGPGDDRVDEAWSRLAIEALLTSTQPWPRGTVSVRCGATTLLVSMDGQGRRVDPSETAAEAVVSGELADLLEAAYTGVIPASARIVGDAAAARRAFAPGPAGS